MNFLSYFFSSWTPGYARGAPSITEIIKIKNEKPQFIMQQSELQDAIKKLKPIAPKMIRIIISKGPTLLQEINSFRDLKNTEIFNKIEQIKSIKSKN